MRDWASLAAGMRDFVMAVDSRGIILAINRTVEGLTQKDALGHSAYDFVPPEQHDVMRQALRALFRTGKPQTYEIQGTGPHGALAWYSTHVGPIRSGSKLVAAVLAARDITERKGLEQALLESKRTLERRVAERTSELEKSNLLLRDEIARREGVETDLRASEDRLKAIFEAMPDLLFHVTRDGTFTSYKAVREEDLAFPPEEFLGKRMMDIFPRELANQAMARVEEAVTTGGIPALEYQLADLKGNLRDFEARFVHDGRQGVLIVSRDVTHRRRSERDLADRAQELEQATIELEKANLRLEELSHEDPLTGALNRRGLERALAREVRRLSPSRADLLAILLDVDNFKALNDSLGHATGDILLVEVARKLRAALRPADHLARIGGDEYMILLPQTEMGEGLRVAERLRLAVSATPVPFSGSPIRVTASLGLVLVSTPTASVAELIALATPALNRGKVEGKDRVIAGQAEGDSRLEPVERILEAFRDGAAHLHTVLQPIVRLSDEAHVAYEFLSRSSVWGFEMPEDFFRLCASGNLLTLVDHQCFRACLAASVAAAPGARIHLNIFPSTLLAIAPDMLLADFPSEQPMDRYCIEISTREVVGSPRYVAQAVERLRRAGLRLAMDDVGFGHSCVEGLIVLEPNLIKISMELIAGLAHKPEQRRGVEKLLKVADSLGAELVAEGIESREDLDALRSMGVPLGQGFLWGRPA